MCKFSDGTDTQGIKITERDVLSFPCKRLHLRFLEDHVEMVSLLSAEDVKTSPSIVPRASIFSFRFKNKRNLS